ncbi:hypothetical protein Sjap_021616 [Stephania japonica]|uniref:Uncharacterized protein n=1 Tax=Stephania japonica TaxID=461633 RepID=A0AAP0HRR4_9MAGN
MKDLHEGATSSLGEKCGVISQGRGGSGLREATERSHAISSDSVHNSNDDEYLAGLSTVGTLAADVDDPYTALLILEVLFTSCWLLLTWLVILVLLTDSRSVVEQEQGAEAWLLPLSFPQSRFLLLLPIAPFLGPRSRTDEEETSRQDVVLHTSGGERRRLTIHGGEQRLSGGSHCERGCPFRVVVTLLVNMLI